MIEVTGLKTGIKYSLPFNMISSMDHDAAKGFTIIYMLEGFKGKSDRYQVIETIEDVLSMADIERLNNE